jgi:hypothetical protein
MQLFRNVGRVGGRGGERGRGRRGDGREIRRGIGTRLEKSKTEEGGVRDVVIGWKDVVAYPMMIGYAASALGVRAFALGVLGGSARPHGFGRAVLGMKKMVER